MRGMNPSSRGDNMEVVTDIRCFTQENCYSICLGTKNLSKMVCTFQTIDGPRHLTLDDFITAGRPQQNVHTQNTFILVHSAAASLLLHFLKTFGDGRLSGCWCGPHDWRKARSFCFTMYLSGKRISSGVAKRAEPHIGDVRVPQRDQVSFVSPRR